MFNLAKTAILMAAITALFIVVGGMLGGEQGMFLALLIAVGMNFFSYWFSDTMVLKMTNAQQVDERSAPQFYAMVKELANKAGLPMPKVFLIEEDAPNAFATGRNPEHASVAATTGILRILSARELACAREAPRYPHFYLGSNHGRRHFCASQSCDVCWWSKFRGSTRQSPRCIIGDDFGSAGSQPNSDEHIPCP
jgi:hypothetical protein